MKVISLFNGIGLSHLALNKAGIRVDKMFISEINKEANKVSNNHFKDDIQLGDMTKLKKRELLKLGKIDLLIGGSSCTDLSSIGGRAGVGAKSLEHYQELKKDGYEFKGESYLFWEFVRILKIVKPKYFLLENVKMKKAHLAQFEDALGVKGVLINSSLVTAQNRERYYFANFDFDLPKDLKINLQDILDTNPKIDIVDSTSSRVGLCKSIKPQIRYNIKNNEKEILNCTKTFHTMKIGVKSGFADNKVALTKSPTIRAQNNATYVFDRRNNVFRRLTINEREKLQTVPIGYTDGLNQTNQVKVLGNAFTADIIVHILSNIKECKDV